MARTDYSEKVAKHTHATAWLSAVDASGQSYSFSFRPDGIQGVGFRIQGLGFREVRL